MSGCSSSRGVRGTHRFPFAECSLVFSIPAAALWGVLLIPSPGALLLGRRGGRTGWGTLGVCGPGQSGLWVGEAVAGALSRVSPCSPLHTCPAQTGASGPSLKSLQPGRGRALLVLCASAAATTSLLLCWCQAVVMGWLLVPYKHTPRTERGKLTLHPSSCFFLTSEIT